MDTLPTYTLLYDSDCRICTSQARQVLHFDSEQRLALLPLGSPLIHIHYPQITPEDAQRWMHIVGPDGRIWRGAEAVRLTLLLLPLGRVVGALLYLPGAMRLARPLYDWFASNRYRFGGYATTGCDGDACAIHLGGTPKKARPQRESKIER